MDNFEICPCCQSNACISTSDGSYALKICWTCGFTTNDLMIEGSDFEQQNFENTAQLIKDLKQTHNGLVWFPLVLNITNVGMVFPEWNKRTRDWYWAVIKQMPIPKEEQHNYPDPQNEGKFLTSKIDPTSIKHYDKYSFMDAAEEIGIFNAE
jgi:hypothetical protein